MSFSAESSPNIAFIKYWGNRNDELRLPAANSLSMTLSSPTVSVTVDHSDTTVVESSKELTATDIGRFEVTLENIRRYLINLGHETCIPGSLSIQVDSKIPAGIGLASSAAVFSAFAKAIAGLANCGLTDEQISEMARLGSGSAARSILGGFVALENTGDTAVARQVAPQDHWNLYDIVIAPDTSHKKVGSSQGHRAARTSPLFDKRIQEIDRRMAECSDAITQKDFEKLAAVTEEDCMDMHSVMQTQNPPLHYLNDDTHRIVEELTALRTEQHLPLLYTMDAGPTVHVICEESAKDTVLAYANEQKGCQVFEASVGGGAHLV